ncbi:hypothetical protein [Paratissierella segnis]|uniref:hypothetical protein n=1 Tax=Paratissierella segnis TaxID=2763679 RepID=UPI00223A9DE9|nr:hypothetical protein [Paratissierella segnis]
MKKKMEVLPVLLKRLEQQKEQYEYGILNTKNMAPMYSKHQIEIDHMQKSLNYQ